MWPAPRFPQAIFASDCNSNCDFWEVEIADLSPCIPDNVSLSVAGAPIVDYRNFAVRGRGRIPKVEDWKVELLEISQPRS
jgi:hypothetical protein